MTTSSIELDLDLLNELFDNQKKLDDLFLDDDSFLSSSILSGDEVPGSSDQKSDNDIVDFHSNDSLLLESDDSIFDQKSHSTIYIVVPMVIEIAAIIYGLMYLI